LYAGGNEDQRGNERANGRRHTTSPLPLLIG
jgi:hypothetical protein